MDQDKFMHYEIEMKAHVGDPGRVQALLDGFASFIRSFDKSDEYFLLPGAQPGKGRNFRIRMDDGQALVTWKNRSYSGSMEVNVEREFGVSDPKAFLELCLSMGASPYILKRKIGREYAFEGFTIELSDVPPLGYFVEIEKIIDVDDTEGESSARRASAQGPGEGLPHSPETSVVRDIRAREAAILERLGIEEAAMEAKPYSLLLREAAKDGAS